RTRIFTSATSRTSSTPSWARSLRRCPGATASSCAASARFRSSIARPVPDAIRARERTSPSSRRACRSSRPARKCASASTAEAERAGWKPASEVRRRELSFAVAAEVLRLRSIPDHHRALSTRAFMIRTFLKALILVPIAVLLIAFAVANRQWSPVSLDPLSSSPRALRIELRLFLVSFLALMRGVVAGGIAAWVGQRKWRRRARRLENDLRDVRTEAESWKRRAEVEREAATPLAPL